MLPVLSGILKGPSWGQHFLPCLRMTCQFLSKLDQCTFADDTTLYCIGVTAEKAIAQLNTAVHELYEWCLINKLTPQPGKSEAMLITRSPPDHFPPIFIGSSLIKWGLLIRSRFLPKNVRQDLFSKVICLQ